MIKALRVSAFAVAAMVLLFGAELSQAVAENFLAPEENRMHGLVNQTRAAQGLRALPEHDALRTIARRQTQNMAAAGYIYHTRDLAQQAKSLSISYSLLGENVGTGPSVEAVEDAFLASPSHRENIVDAAFNSLGVGAIAGQNGALYFAQDFGALRAAPPPAPPATRTQAPAPVRPPSTAPAQVAAARPVVPAPTVRPTPAPVVPPVLESLDRYPVMAGTQSGRGISVTRPSAAKADRGRRASLPAVLASMGGRFFSVLAFWK